MQILTQEIVRELLDYNPDNGNLVWRFRNINYFKSKHDCKAWNTKNANMIAGTDCNGYIKLYIFGKGYFAHRIVFLWVTGKLPKNDIDHINGKTSDNRFINLRNVCNQVNHKNRKLNKNSVTGYIGINTIKNSSRLRVRINVDGKSKYVGSFATLQQAITAQNNAYTNYGYHNNHGRAL